VPSLKAIRKRISTVKSTQKITRAMKMVAGARLARAQARMLALRPYAQKTQEVLMSLAARPAEQDVQEALAQPPLHPYLVERPEKTVAFLVLTSDRGLCGAFNANINKAAERTWRERSAKGETVQIYTLGRKGRDYLRRRQAPVTHDFANVWNNMGIDTARQIAGTVVPLLVKGEIDAIYIIYSEFKSAMSQRIVIEPLLPLRRPEPGKKEETKEGDQPEVEYIFEPNRAALLDRLLPMYVETTILRAMLESVASELGARMTAMDSATKNAKQAIEGLTLTYNRARQAAITKELMEIIGGAEALKE
jgi:F-type H+-transporting ATPase subunit gamma